MKPEFCKGDCHLFQTSFTSIAADRENGRDVVVGALEGLESEQFIPANDRVETELEVQFKPGRNTADFTLMSGK